MRNVLLNGLRLLLAIVTALVLTCLVIWASKASPSIALSTLVSGAFGTQYDFGNTLNKMTPLLLTGLGVALAFRARLWNIGGEGQFLLGALAASAFGVYNLKHLPAIILIPLMLLGGACAGALWAMVAGWMRVARNVPEVISTIMLNFVAAQLLSYLIHGPMEEASKSQPATEALPQNATLPIILANTNLHAGIFVALVAAILCLIYLYRTPWGYALRVVGANPAAARAAGIDVAKTQIGTMALSGALCGLAGAVELSGLLGTIYENYAPGYGFTAVAVALLGRLNPIGIVGSALFFGALTAGSGNMERHGNVSSNLAFVIQAIALLVLLGFQWVHWDRTPRVRATANVEPDPSVPV